MEKMKKTMILWMVGEMLARLKPAMIKQWIDQGLDMLENKIAESPTTVDDTVVLPVIGVLRDALNVPDND